ncbi:MAG: cupredoxin domain-containing protein [Candidatus Pacebacteria bacterium]|nr:cupredoxin domain-containing protein [Candidatus Paceibacterota bacterium]
MDTKTIIAFAISAVLIGWAFLISSKPSNSADAGAPPTAVIVDGTQIIDITAKGGYSPRVVTAKAGVPTILRMRTNGTFDCSASVVIPKLSYQKFLQPSTVEEISISAAQAQGTLQGLCSMGMYNFQIKFE